MIDSTQHGGEDAHVGFCSCHHQNVRVAVREELLESMAGEGGIDRLVEYRGWWRKRLQRR